MDRFGCTGIQVKDTFIEFDFIACYLISYVIVESLDTDDRVIRIRKREKKSSVGAAKTQNRSTLHV